MSTISGIQEAMRQMQSLAAQAAGAVDKAPAAGSGAGDFGKALRTSLDAVNGLQQHADNEAQAFQLGKPGVELHQVMADTQEASLALQMSIQVRNRLVNAYKEIMNMQV